mgnify:CR=1 FL=1
MSHSFAQHLPLACSACGEWFAPELWLIIDATERPGWGADAAAGAFSRAHCPHCGGRSAVDAPLLLFRPGRPTPLVFCPPTWVSGADAYQAVEAALMGRLHDSLGSGWRPEWPRRPVYLPVEMLAVLAEDEDVELFAFEDLANDAATRERIGLTPAVLADMHTWVATAAAVGRMHPAVRAAMSEIVTTLQGEGIAIVTEDDLNRALQAHPALLARLEAAERQAEAEGTPPYGPDAVD